MSILSFQIKEIPDLSLNKYQTLSDTGISGVLKRHSNFIRQWHGICLECNVTMHLLYIFVPTELQGQRLKLYLMFQGERENLQVISPLIEYSPLNDYFDFIGEKVPNVKFAAGATLIKNERIAEIYNPLTSEIKKVHYVPKIKMNADARLYDLFRFMEAIGKSYNSSEACAYRVDLYPVSMAQEIRSAFEPVLKDLRGDNDIKLVKDVQGVKNNDYAREICKEYEEWLTAVETSPHFRMNIYGFASNTFRAKILLNAAASEAISEGNFSIAKIKPDANGKCSVISRMGEKAEEYCMYGQNASISSWSTTYVLEEVEPFFRMPVLFDGEVIELQKETAPKPYNNGIYIGVDENGFPVNFPTEYLPRHAFFTGVPGSGKTNTMLHIITELRKQGIPFLAMEPAKKEYRELLCRKEMQDISLFSPHLQSHFPLQINPFEFPKGVRLSEHINAVLEVFEGSFVLEGPTYKFLSSSIQTAYFKLGWDIEDINNEKTEKYGYPTLQDIYDNLEAEIKQSSYDAEIKGNVRAFLQVRLGGLMERDAGEMFNTNISTFKPEEWIEKSAIVELEVLNEQAKNFFVLLVCHYILETLRANPKGGVDLKTGKLLPVRHVIFIEEAHNIIAPSADQSGSDSVNPKISATAYIVKMLAEVRALREAIVIADQLPTALATEVTKNTGLKLVHRLTSQDDRSEIGTVISASSLQMEQMTSFTKGKALIFHEKTVKPYQVQVAEWKKPVVNYDFTDDSQLYQQIMHQKHTMDAIYTAIRAWGNKCKKDIDPQYKTILAKGAELCKKFDSVKVITLQAEQAVLKGKCRNYLNKCERMKTLWLSESRGMPDQRCVRKLQEISAYISNMEKCL